MSNSIYTPITAPFANTEFVSIRVDDIDYYIVSQLPMDENGISGFPVLQIYVARDFKRILGKDSPLSKFATPLNSRKVVCISHDQLSEVVKYFARKKDCNFCWGLLDASFNTELRRANDYQRGCLKKEEDYQDWLAERDASVVSRLNYTDYIKRCGDSGMEINYPHLTIEVYRYTKLLDKHYAWRAVHETKSERRKNPFRDTLNKDELEDLGFAEDLIARIGTKYNLSPQEAIERVATNL